MHSGGLESLKNSIDNLRPTLRGNAAATILVMGIHASRNIQANDNVVVWSNQEAERALHLPKGLCVVLTDTHHSHKATGRIRALCRKKRVDPPFYILRPGQTKEVLEILLKEIDPEIYSTNGAALAHPPRELVVVHTIAPKPLFTTPESKRLTMLSFENACTLLEEWLDLRHIRSFDQDGLAEEIAAVLELTDNNISSDDFDRLVWRYGYLAAHKSRRPLRGKGVRRMAELERLTFRSQ